MAAHPSLKHAIVKHLSACEDSYSSTVSKVSKETGAGRHFVEAAMNELIERGELKRVHATGAIEGKYKPFTETRLDTPSKSGPSTVYDRGAWNTPLNPKVST